MDEKKQTIEADNYTICMERALYESTTKVGYCVFSVTKKNGKPEIETINEDISSLAFFGNNKRFEFNINCENSSFATKAEMIKDKLYIYLILEADDKFDNRIELIDHNKKNKEHDFESYYFHLKDKGKAIKFIIENKVTITMSPIAFVVTSQEEIAYNKFLKSVIEIYYKNGEKESLFDRNDQNSGFSVHMEIVLMMENGEKRVYF